PAVANFGEREYRSRPIEIDPSTTSRLTDATLFVLLVLEKVLARDLLVGHGGELDQEIDGLLFEDRGPDCRHRSRVLAVVFPDLLLAPGQLARAFDDSARDLVLGYGDLVFFANFREHQAKAHPSLRDAAIFLARLLFSGPFIGKGAALRLKVVFDRGPDVSELVLGESRRQSEFVHLVQPIEKLAFEFLAAERCVLLLQSPFNDVLELIQ